MGIPESKKLFTTHDAAKVLGVTPITVIRWIEAGKLNCFTTVGGHRRIPEEDLARFAKSYNLPWNSNFPHADRKEYVVLAVDDEPDVLEPVRDILRDEADLRLVEASNGFSAGAKLMEEKPDLILLDFMMPELDGFDFCRFMRQDVRFKDIPVVAMTGLKTDEDQRRMKEVGVNDFLFKPFDSQMLLDKIHQFKDHKRSNGTNAPAA